MICARDPAMVPERQRAMAQHARSVVEWETGHSPLLSRPELVAEPLLRLAA